MIRTPTKSVLERPCLVLNRSWVAIRVTTVRRALCLVFGDAARVVHTESLQAHEFFDWCRAPHGPGRHWIRTPSCRVPAPEVIQLLGYNRIPAYAAPFTRKNLFERDGHTCQYCGRRFGTDRLSIDHVQPRSKGGRTSWENCVLACVRCNSTKGDRSVHEAGLRLLRRPRPPQWTPYLNLRQSEHLASWAQFTRPQRARRAAE